MPSIGLTLMVFGVVLDMVVGSGCAEKAGPGPKSRRNGSDCWNRRFMNEIALARLHSTSHARAHISQST